MASASLVMVLLGVSLSLLLHSPSPVEATTATGTPSNLVIKICSKDEFCLKAFKADPRTSSAKDLLAISKIALDLAITNATNTRYHIKSWLDNKDIKIAFQRILTKCVNWYLSVVGSFQSAHVELEHDAMTASYDVLIAGDGVNYCEKEFSSRRVPIPSSIVTKNEAVKHFVTIGTTVTNLLQKEQSSPPSH